MPTLRRKGVFLKGLWGSSWNLKNHEQTSRRTGVWGPDALAGGLQRFPISGSLGSKYQIPKGDSDWDLILHESSLAKTELHCENIVLP